MNFNFKRVSNEIEVGDILVTKGGTAFLVIYDSDGEWFKYLELGELISSEPFFKTAELKAGIEERYSKVMRIIKAEYVKLMEV